MGVAGEGAQVVPGNRKGRHDPYNRRVGPLCSWAAGDVGPGPATEALGTMGNRCRATSPRAAPRGPRRRRRRHGACARARGWTPPAPPPGRSEGPERHRVAARRRRRPHWRGRSGNCWCGGCAAGEGGASAACGRWRRKTNLTSPLTRTDSAPKAPLPVTRARPPCPARHPSMPAMASQRMPWSPAALAAYMSTSRDAGRVRWASKQPSTALVPACTARGMDSGGPGSRCVRRWPQRHPPAGGANGCDGATGRRRQGGDRAVAPGPRRRQVRAGLPLWRGNRRGNRTSRTTGPAWA